MTCKPMLKTFFRIVVSIAKRNMFTVALFAVLALVQPLTVLSVTHSFAKEDLQLDEPQGYDGQENPFSASAKHANKLGILKKGFWKSFLHPRLPGYLLRSRSDSKLCDDSVAQVYKYVARAI